MVELTGKTTPWNDEDMEQYRWLDTLLLEQVGTKKEFQPAWQAYKYLLGGKMYAYIGYDDKNRRPIITLKLEPSHSSMLRTEFADIVPGYYMNKEHWSTIYLDGEVPEEVQSQAIEASHSVVLSSLSKKMQRELVGEKE